MPGKFLLCFLLLTLTFAPAQAAWPRRCTFEELAPNGFLPLRQDLPFLRQNWALDASGADLMRNHPSLRDGDYENNKVAVIDTGLYLTTNPDAGAPLRRGSPEVEHDQHGTGVAGVVASKRFGVNPRLRVVAVPVKYNQVTPISAFMGASPGLNRLSLREKWKTIIEDPTVSVINLSMTHVEDPVVAEYIREALAKGKWVVFSAGNSGKVNDASSAAMSEFNGQPGFFISGALSYLGAPASFSHRGPGVKFYSPGTSVETLNAGFNQNLAQTRTDTAFDGTSFSAPHLSAVLATMRALEPKLTFEQAEAVLEATAIRRGQNGEYLQVNPYHAIELLTRAKQLESEGACRGASACQKAAHAAIKAELELGNPTAPVSASRTAWMNYYNQLRRNYFLSNGAPEFAEPLRNFLIGLGRHDAAETVYFAAARDSAPATALKPEGEALRREFQRARIALAEKGPEAITDATPSSEIPLTVANLEIFLRRGQTFFETGVDADNLAATLNHAKKPFMMALAGRLVESGKPLATPFLIGLVSRVATTPAEKELLGKVVDLAVQGWKGNVDILELFLTNYDLVTPDQRGRLLRAFLTHKKAGTLSEYASPFRESVLDPEHLGALEAMMRAWQKNMGVSTAQVRNAIIAYPNNTIPPGWEHLNDFAYAATRFRAGHGDTKSLTDSLQRLIDAERAIQARGQVEESNKGQVVVSFLASARHSEAGARALARKVLEGDNFKVLAGVVGADNVFAQLLNAVNDGPLREKILKAYLPLILGDVTRNHSVADQLFAIRNVPEVKEFLDGVVGKKQTDPALEHVRQRLLLRYAHSTPNLNDEGRAFVDENAVNGVKPYTSLPFSQVVNDPKLLKELQAILASPKKDSYQPTALLQWAMSGTAKDFMKIAPQLVDQFPANMKVSPYVSLNQMQAFGDFFAAIAGADPKLNETLMGHLDRMLRDPTYAGRPEHDQHRTKYDRSEGVALVILELARGKEGAKLLAANPKLLERLADKIVNTPDFNYLCHGERLFEPLGKLLAKKLPTVDQLVATGKFPKWAFHYLRYEPAELDRVLEYLKDPRLKPESMARRELLNALITTGTGDPKTVIPKLRQFAKDHPTSGVNLVLDQLGYSQ